jgi:hypothetical protein
MLPRAAFAALLMTSLFLYDKPFRRDESFLCDDALGPRRKTIPASNHYFDYDRTLSGRTCTGNFALSQGETVLNQNSNPLSKQSLLTSKLIHLAVPVRWSLIGSNRASAEMACTYDVHPQGARLLSARSVNVGDLMLIERGRNKATCRVIWAAHPESPLRGQFTVECVEGRAPWEEELRQAQEEYQPLVLDGMNRKASRSFRAAESNRRQHPRFYAEGQAEVIGAGQRVAGEVDQISEYGARINSLEPLRPGTDFRLMLNMCDVSVSLKAQVKYLVSNLGMGVQFQEIRRGDRPLLSYVLSTLKKRRVEEFARVEVVSEPLPAAV